MTRLGIREGSPYMSGLVLAAAAALIWFGMVIAISFIEAPLKFRAPGITTQLGLGIGKIVFLALNIAEVLLGIVVAGGLLAAGTWSTGSAWLAVALGLLVVQLAVIRPVLRRSSRRVLAGGESGSRSGTHWFYVGAEVAKVVALVTGALVVLSAA